MLLNLFFEEMLYSTQKNIIYRQSQDIDVVTLPANGERICEGGLRLEGKYKVTTSDKPLISVVTVVFNGELFIEETILSVLDQTYDNIEYIIIDAGSSDGTVDIIRKYGYAVDYWVSESDDGIYDAMNKGGKVAQGRYLHFLNAGDRYYEKDVLNKVYPALKSKYSIAIGAAEFVYTNSQRVIKKARLSKFEMPNCHQACFYFTSEFQNKYYSTEYKILADFNYWFDQFVLSHADVVIIDEIICCYDMNGISNTSIIKASKEKLGIFYSAPLWRYKVLGTVDVFCIFIRITLAKILQRVGIRAILVRLKLQLFR